MAVAAMAKAVAVRRQADRVDRAIALLPSGTHGVDGSSIGQGVWPNPMVESLWLRQMVLAPILFQHIRLLSIPPTSDCSLHRLCKVDKSDVNYGR